MSGNREYKSDVFSMLMENKAYALDVYNALNDSDYLDPEEVEIVKLEKGVSLSMRNDASFIVDMNFSFYEHQSTNNPNIALRSMIYYINALEDWLKRNKKDLFSSRAIKIPTPHFVVFYNGLEKRPEYEEKRLSKQFLHESDNPQIEVICKIFNINPPYNQGLKSKSEVLYGYTYFVEKVRENQIKGMDLEKAIDDAIEDCIANHILEDFFRARKDEVKKVTHLDYTWEKREELIRNEEFEEGMAQGMERGMAQGIQNLLLELLEELGELPDDLGSRIMSEKDLDTLKKWHKFAFKANSMEDFMEKCKFHISE